MFGFEMRADDELENAVGRVSAKKMYHDHRKPAFYGQSGRRVKFLKTHRKQIAHAQKLSFAGGIVLFHCKHGSESQNSLNDEIYVRFTDKRCE